MSRLKDPDKENIKAQTAIFRVQYSSAGQRNLIRTLHEKEYLFANTCTGNT